MKLVFLILSGLGIATASFAAEIVDDSSISNRERGFICRAIDAKYPDTLASENGRPGWVVCRDGGARFSHYSAHDPNYYTIAANTAPNVTVICTASLRPSGHVKNPAVIAACWWR